MSGALSHLVQTENWALHVARTAHLATAESRLATFEDREAIVVTRYDRTTTGERRHQEDFCQAIGLPPQAKYESTAESKRHGSRLKRIARTAAARAADPDTFRATLLQAVTFNGKTSIDVIDVEDLSREGASWGMSGHRAASIVQSCMENVYDVISSVPLPPGAEQVKRNLDAMWARRGWSIERAASAPDNAN